MSYIIRIRNASALIDLHHKHITWKLRICPRGAESCLLMFVAGPIRRSSQLICFFCSCGAPKVSPLNLLFSAALAWLLVHRSSPLNLNLVSNFLRLRLSPDQSAGGREPQIFRGASRTSSSSGHGQPSWPRRPPVLPISLARRRASSRPWLPEPAKRCTPRASCFFSFCFLCAEAPS